MTGHRYFFAPVLAAACLLLAPATQAQGLFSRLTGGDKPEVVDLTDQSDFAEAYGKAFQQPGALAHAFRRPDFALRKLAIGSFQIEFAVEQSGLGKGTLGAQNKSYNYFLRNVQDAQMQSVTDKAYAAFVEMAKARGYEIVSPEAIAGTAFKAELDKASKVPTKWTRGALAGMVGQNNTQQDNVTVTAVAAGVAPYTGLQFTGTPLSKLAAEMGAVSVGIKLKVNYAQIKDTGGVGLAEVDTKPRTMIAATDSVMALYTPDANQWQLPVWRAIVLPNPIAEKTTQMTVTTEEKTKAVAKVGLDVALGFLGFSGGRGGISGAAGGINHQNAGEALGDSPNYEITASADYEEKVSKDLALALSVFAQALPK